MNSPFNFGRAVKSDCFTNRETELKKLTSNFRNKVNTTIISPRRWGKSSLVEKAVSQIKSKDTKVVIMDLFSHRTEEDFYITYANSIIKATSSKTEEWIETGKRFLKTISPKFIVELGENKSFALEFDLESLKKNYKELLDLPEKIAIEKKINIIVCIDEFQNIASFGNHLAIQKRLRSIWQHHQHVTYCLYGSKQHMMLDLFNKQSNPFYKFGELMYLPKIQEQKWVTYITKQFTKTKKEISSDLALQVAKIVKCHPYHVQHLSHILWTNTENKATENLFKQSVNQLLDHTSLLYYKETENLNNTELNLLKAIAKGEKQLSAKDTIYAYKLGTSANVVKAKKTLLDKELTDNHVGTTFFLDPLFELWFAKNVMNIDII